MKHRIADSLSFTEEGLTYSTMTVSWQSEDAIARKSDSPAREPIRLPAYSLF